MRYPLFFLIIILVTNCKKGKIIDCSSLKYLNEKTLFNGSLFTGECNSFYPSAKIRSIQKYTSGLDDGKWVFYYENGKTQTTGKFKNGKRIGEWKYYYENGNLKQESYYNSLGEKAGTWKVYDPEGKLDWVNRIN